MYLLVFARAKLNIEDENTNSKRNSKVIDSQKGVVMNNFKEKDEEFDEQTNNTKFDQVVENKWKSDSNVNSWQKFNIKVSPSEK